MRSFGELLRSLRGLVFSSPRIDVFLPADSCFPECGIINNFAENAIRPFVIGRKNWPFSDTVKGAKSSAVIYSLIETAKANGIEPYTYLNLILTDMQYMGRPFSNEELENFMPWSEEIKDSIAKRIEPAPLTEE